MPYIEAEALQQARRVDLLSWMQANEPWNIVRISANNYCTKEHDSLKISNGKWYWFPRGIGGRSALDYLIKVKELPFIEAVERIAGHSKLYPVEWIQDRGGIYFGENAISHNLKTLYSF